MKIEVCELFTLHFSHELQALAKMKMSPVKPGEVLVQATCYSEALKISEKIMETEPYKSLRLDGIGQKGDKFVRMVEE